MNLKNLLIVAAAGIMLLSLGCSPENDVTATAQEKCPIMGGTIDKEVFTDHYAGTDSGKRVYFCCPGCISKFKENPEKHIQKLEDAGVSLEKAPQL
jgi:YHS domain-containing protein